MTGPAATPTRPFWKLAHEDLRLFQRAAVAFSLSTIQYAVLLAIADDSFGWQRPVSKRSQRKIAQDLGVSRSTVSRATAKLVRLGLVRDVKLGQNTHERSVATPEELFELLPVPDIRGILRPRRGAPFVHQ